MIEVTNKNIQQLGITYIEIDDNGQITNIKGIMSKTHIKGLKHQYNEETRKTYFWATNNIEYIGG